MAGWQRAFAEWFGTAALLAVVVGSGHMGETLAPDNAAMALLANSLATALALWVLIELFAPISGAHFNPAVSLALFRLGELGGGDCAMYICAQISGALCGVALAHLMFGLDPFALGVKVRAGLGQDLSEAVATAGLLLTILLGRRSRPQAVPAMVGAYIGSAYWFTASTAFANPAVTLARALTTTFAGIRPRDVPAFIVAQLVGAAAALLIVHALKARPASVESANADA